MWYHVGIFFMSGNMSIGKEYYWICVVYLMYKSYEALFKIVEVKEELIGSHKFYSWLNWVLQQFPQVSFLRPSNLQTGCHPDL